MRKLFILIPLALLCFTGLNAQKVSGKLNFVPGKTYTVVTTEKTTVAQEAMGQTIDFKTTGSTIELYKVTTSSVSSSMLHHSIQRINFSFDGMGSVKSYDTNSETDLNDEMGRSLKELLGKSYDLELDPFGKVILATPPKFEMMQSDDPMNAQIIKTKSFPFLYPPQKGEASFFKILPETEVAVGDSWTDAKNTEQEKSSTVYTISAITETSIVVNFKSTGIATTKSQMMNIETKSEIYSNASGQITLDRSSGILKEKMVTIEKTGITEAMGSKVPFTSTSSISTTVSVAP